MASADMPWVRAACSSKAVGKCRRLGVGPVPAAAVGGKDSELWLLDLSCFF